MQNVEVAGKFYHKKSIIMHFFCIGIGGRGKDLVLKWSLIGIERFT